MKLLLTSSGITTQTLADELTKLAGQGSKKIAFIPTAANAEPNGPWFLSQLDNLRKFGFNKIDFVDPSAAENDWQKRLNAADIIFVSGGNTFHLLNQARKTGFGDWLKQNIANKIYVGASAGSILVTPSIGVAGIDNADPNIPKLTDLSGYSFVDFEVVPHMGAMFSEESIEKYVNTTKNKLYGVNDNSAVRVVNGSTNVIHDGKFWEYN